MQQFKTGYIVDSISDTLIKNFQSESIFNTDDIDNNILNSTRGLLKNLSSFDIDFNFNPRKEGYAIKIPVFSYEKFPDVKKELGPEMKSTGEAIRFIKNLKDPFFTKVYSERNMHLSR